ncbi:hypothetical protein [Pseudomonas sp. NPDC007930]|uniref:hypothetical protein n=1 Tax=Pseudomonas sp. NPDC007930 TaxID=3364417 RepID=UPI0036ED8DA9
MTDLASGIAEAGQCALLFRLGREVEGALRMVALFEQLLPTVQAQAPALLPPLTEQLSDIFSRQQAQDWLGLADSLQYELAELLRQGA